MSKQLQVFCQDHMWHFLLEEVESYVVVTNGCLEVTYKDGLKSVFAHGYWKHYVVPKEDQNA